MKVLTVRQAWAQAIFAFGKDVDNRSKPTIYRGQLWIHAGASRRAIEASKKAYAAFDIPFPDQLVFGAILGQVELIGCCQDSASRWAKPGQYHWQFANPLLLPEPIYCKGQVGLWNANPDLAAQLQSLATFE